MLETIIVASPQLAGYVTAPAGATGLRWEEFVSPGEIAESVRRTAESFRIPSPAAAAHLRFVNVVKAWMTPTLTGFVESVVADLDLRGATLWTIDHVWYAYNPGPAASVHDSVAAAGECLSELIAATAAATGLRPAPLWAQAADLIAIACVEAGNEAYAPDEAVEVLAEVMECLRTEAGVPIPWPHVVCGPLRRRLAFTGVPGPGECGVGDVDAEDFLSIRRLTCCHIDRSEVAATCTDCPHAPGRRSSSRGV